MKFDMSCNRFGILGDTFQDLHDGLVGESPQGGAQALAASARGGGSERRLQCFRGRAEVDRVATHANVTASRCWGTR